MSARMALEGLAATPAESGASLGGPAASEVSYQLTFLGSGHPTGINASGEISGYFPGAGGENEAVEWSSMGVLTVLPGLGGSGSEALAINDAGVVAGSSQSSDGSSHAVVWSATGALTTLAAQSGWDVSPAYAIDASGETAGSYGYALAGGTGVEAPVVWSSAGAPTVLTGAGNGTYVDGVNESGVCVGYSSGGLAVEWAARSSGLETMTAWARTRLSPWAPVAGLHEFAGRPRPERPGRPAGEWLGRRSDRHGRGRRRGHALRRWRRGAGGGGRRVGGGRLRHHHHGDIRRRRPRLDRQNRPTLKALPARPARRSLSRSIPRRP